MQYNLFKTTWRALENLCTGKFPKYSQKYFTSSKDFTITLSDTLFMTPPVSNIDRDKPSDLIPLGINKTPHRFHRHHITITLSDTPFMTPPVSYTHLFLIDRVKPSNLIPLGINKTPHRFHRHHITITLSDTPFMTPPVSYTHLFLIDRVKPAILFPLVSIRLPIGSTVTTSQVFLGTGRSCLTLSIS